MKLKRILAALAVGTLALGIFGCGGSEKAAESPVDRPVNTSRLYLF